MNINKAIIFDHLKDNVTIYVFMTTLFLTGIVFGAIIVNSMSFIQKQDLFFHVNQYFHQVVKEDMIQSKDILQKSFFFHIKYLFVLFILGLTIIGIPLIWILLFIKGVVIGFSVGFIVNQLGWKGLMIATLSIAPQNIVIIPVYIIAGSLSMLFSLGLIQKIFARHVSHTLGKPFLQYSFVFMLLTLIALGSSIVETFVSNEAFKTLMRSII